MVLGSRAGIYTEFFSVGVSTFKLKKNTVELIVAHVCITQM